MSNPQQHRLNSKEGNDDAAADETTPASITNIYYDCLERIFDLLDLKSLLNVARTCKRLQIAAAAKFNDEYGKKNVFMYMGKSYQNQLQLDEASFHIAVHGFELSLPFLRCFGAKIRKLIVSFHSNDHAKLQAIVQYINQYCGDTLTNITILNVQNLPWKFITKSFKNVIELTILGDYLDERVLSGFANIFPNVQSMYIHIYGIHRYENDLAALHFLHLNNLSICVNLPNSNDNSIIDLLNANLQLQCLKITIINELTNFATLSKVIIGMPSISKLELEDHKFCFRHGRKANAEMKELLQFADKYPSIVDLDFGHFIQVTVDDAIAFARQHNALKKFRFQVENLDQYNRLTDSLIKSQDNNWQCEYQYYEINDKHYITLSCQ